MGISYFIEFYFPKKESNRDLVQHLHEICSKNDFTYENTSQGKYIYVETEGDNIYRELSYEEIITKLGNPYGGDIFIKNDKFTVTLGISPLGDFDTLSGEGPQDTNIGVIGLYAIQPNVLFSVKGQDYEKNFFTLLSLSTEIYNYLHPIFGRFGSDYEQDGEVYSDVDNFPPLDEEILRLEINRLYKVNYYSPALVDKIGRKKIFSLKNYSPIELKDGGALIYYLGEDCGDIDPELRMESETHLGFR